MSGIYTWFENILGCCSLLSASTTGSDTGLINSIL